MNRRPFVAVSAAAALLALTGCANPTRDKFYGSESACIVVMENGRAASVPAEVLSKQASPGAPALVTTIVNLDRLDEALSTGRMSSAQGATGLVRYGVTVVEGKMANALFICSGQNEMMLSREVKVLTLTHRADFVIVDTYAWAGRPST